jgi:hypothetical protein
MLRKVNFWTTFGLLGEGPEFGPVPFVIDPDEAAFEG